MALLLVDLDGTLVDPGPGIIGSCRHALESLGRPCPPDTDLRWIIGPPLRQSFATLLGPDADPELAVSLYRERYGVSGLFEASVYPGVPAALAALQAAGHRLRVCTAKPTVFADRIVQRFGLAPWFDGVHGAELDGRLDDKADLIDQILSATGYAEPVCMIGDRRHDVAAAARHGLSSIGVLWGYGDVAELTAAGATRLCEQPQGLAEAVAAALG